MNTIAINPSPARINESVIELAKEYLSAIFPSRGDSKILLTEPSIVKSDIAVNENPSSSLV